MVNTRLWCGQCQYPGLEQFYLGTVIAEREMDAVDKLKELWAKISPHPVPPIIVAIPGMLVFSPL